MSKNKALFLDRDGVINKDLGHVYKIKDFKLIKNIEVLIRKANKKFYKIIIVTNQAGIGKQLYTEEDYKKLTKYMKFILAKKKCYIDGVYHCPYHPKEAVGNYLMDSFDRKPNPGMLLKAKKDFNLDMKKSIFIGDKLTDMEAGINAQVKTNILFNCNYKIKISKISCNFFQIKCLKEAIKYL